MGGKNIGFVSTRLAGTDGVSLETMKWADVLESLGHKCFYMAGELDQEPEKCFLVEEAHFSHPAIRDVYCESFAADVRSRSVTDRIHELSRSLKDKVYEFVERFNIDLLIPENVLAIPLNIPLAVALTEFISETRMPTIAHHHDFFWERKRFLTNAVWEYLNMAFPPHLPSIQHVVINSSADNQLSLRTGVSATVIPNVMAFEKPPAGPDEYAAGVRSALGLEPYEKLVLQPTRVVARKGIEHAIELVSRLDLDVRLVISHASGDEGYEYEKRVKAYAQLMGANALFVSDIINECRCETPDGRKVFAIQDIYPYADLVTYPSTFEGFGNAFLEAIYFKKPIVVNNYSVFSVDIKPKGFKVIEFDEFITDETVKHARQVLMEPEACKEMVEENYRLGLKHYSYTVLCHRLQNLLINCFGA
jgi:glycosyltransferase involved in cell wall biosynthesis